MDLTGYVCDDQPSVETSKGNAMDSPNYDLEDENIYSGLYSNTRIEETYIMKLMWLLTVHLLTAQVKIAVKLEM